MSPGGGAVELDSAMRLFSDGSGQTWEGSSGNRTPTSRAVGSLYSNLLTGRHSVAGRHAQVAGGGVNNGTATNLIDHWGQHRPRSLAEAGERGRISRRTQGITADNTFQPF